MATLSDTARAIFDYALAECSVERAMARQVAVRDGRLHIGGDAITLAGLRHVRIVAVGKAANAMLHALLALPVPMRGCDVAGIVIAPKPPSLLPAGFEYFGGGHPVPNEASFAGARAALAMVESVSASTTLCLFLISGGASAMMELPLDPDISLTDTADFHRALVASGASIAEINCVRKHFSAVKGGRLALATGDALCHSLLVSDVPPGREDALGSGPTQADSSTVAECRGILTRYQLLSRFPAAVRGFFESETLPETAKSGELNARVTVLLGADDLARTAAHRAEKMGWTAVIDNSCDDWDYRSAAKHLLERVRELRRQQSRVCLISAGEVTVALPREGVGSGGRNQQFALYAATLIAPEDGEVAILSAGSDGIDGNSPAAGAVVDHQTLAGAGRESVRALEQFDAHPFLADRSATITTGHSGNNLRDLRILLAP